MKPEQRNLAKLVARNTGLTAQRDALLAAYKQNERTMSELRHRVDALFARIGKLEWRLYHRSAWAELWQWMTGKHPEEARDA